MEGVLDRIGRAYWIENGRSVLASCSPTRSVAGEGRGGKEAGSSRGSVVEECKEAILAKGGIPLEGSRIHGTSLFLRGRGPSSRSLSVDLSASSVHPHRSLAHTCVDWPYAREHRCHNNY